MDYKGYDIKGDGSYGYKNIAPIGGKGSIPVALKGTYTTSAFAERAIDAYLTTNKKVKGNGKDDSTS